jgi:hypothetical protein
MRIPSSSRCWYHVGYSGILEIANDQLAMSGEKNRKRMRRRPRKLA